MKKKLTLKIIIALLLVVTVLAPVTQAKAELSWYTYNYDFYDEETPSPNPYVPTAVLTGTDLGVGNLKNPQSLFVRDEFVYLVDTGNNRILEFSFVNEQFELVRTIDSFSNNGEPDSFNGPMDVFVGKEMDIYIADNKNFRILHLDKDLNLIKAIYKPDDQTIAADADFLPCKLVVDDAGRIYVQATNINKGLMEFDSEGNFTAYIGASEVKFDMIEYIWKMLSTKEQKSRMVQFVPTEYNNLALDSDGFIYVTTATFDESELRADKAKPIRKLNAMGTDILVKNGYYPPIGDLFWGRAGNISGSSKFVDIVVADNDTYYAIDRTRGRVFAYDFQGNMLYAFGGVGNKPGYFQNPSAIEMVGSTLLVLDYSYGTVTQLTITEYGELINEGLNYYKIGDYEASAAAWEKVLKLNGNYDLAYIGIGRALLRQERYEEAMKYFKLKHHYENYSKAFKLYRKVWIEENIGTIFIIILVALAAAGTVGIVKRIRKEGMED